MPDLLRNLRNWEIQIFSFPVIKTASYCRENVKIDMKTEEVILMRKMEYSPESDFNVNYDGKSMVILSCGDKESREIIVPP